MRLMLYVGWVLSGRGLYVVNRDDNPDFKLVWMVPIAALPVVGAVIYLFVRLQLWHARFCWCIRVGGGGRRGLPAGRKARRRPCVRCRGGAAAPHRLWEKRGFRRRSSADRTYDRWGMR